MARARNYYTIGEVVSRLKGNYPDLSISKVRYLEEEGLLSLPRTKGGYRQFTEGDLARLAVILKLQREQFLPLNVIKQRIDSADIEAELEADPAAETPNGESGPMVSLAEAAGRNGLSLEQIKSLESFGLIKPVDGADGKSLTRDDMQVAVNFGQLQRYGIEPRHLRMYVNFAQREALLFQQILSPQIKHKGQQWRQRAREDLRTLVQLTERIKRVLLQKSVDSLESAH